MEKIFNRFPLFPNYFKKIALILLVGIFVSLVLNKAHLFTINKEFYSLLSHQGIIIAFFIIVFSRDKFEDELIAQIRFSSIAQAFIMGTGIWLFSSIFDSVFKLKSSIYNEAYFILFMIFWFYFFIFYRMKKLRLK